MYDSFKNQFAQLQHRTMSHSDIQLKPYQHVIAASIGGLITSFTVSPLDVVKSRLQSQVGGYTTTIDAFIKIARYEGIKVLWSGLIPSIAITVPANALYFALYEKFNNNLWPYLGYFTPMIAGSTARIITSTATSPIELIRTYQQSNNIKLNTRDLITKLIKEKGLMRMWVGLYPTLWRDVPFSAIYWSSFELIKHKISPYNNTFLSNFISGAISGIIAAIFTLPFDVMKTRQQMHIDKFQNITPMRSLFIKIYKEEGISGFMKGAVPRAARVAPACAIMISCYEFLKSVIIKQKSETNQL